MHPALRRLDTADLVLVGYLLGLAVYWWAVDTDREAWTDQDVLLAEDHLQRLEAGETVQIQRWHGQDLELSGMQVIDVEHVEETGD